jgi:Tfp pilus assembly protein PilF
MRFWLPRDSLKEAWRFSAFYFVGARFNLGTMDRFMDLLQSQARALAKECMDPMVVYLGVLALFVLGALLFRNTSIHEFVGGTEYESKRRRRFAGVTLMALAAICGGVEMLSQSNSPSYDLPPLLLKKKEQEVAQARTSPSAESVSSSKTALANAVATYPVSQMASPDEVPAGRVGALLREASQLLQQRLLDSALDKVNEALVASPQSVPAFCLRGNIYAEQKLWDEAGKDYQTVLQLDSKNKQVRFDMAELAFIQKKYDEAQPGFAALKEDSDLGDLAAYKVFLCDLYGGHEEAAAKELDAFNQVGSNASYYFANVAWSLYHHKTEEGRTWILSAGNIYGPRKLSVYANSLVDLGYLPLPQSPQPPEQK